MAYTKRIWKGRQGTGLNKFSIDGATPVTVVNQPDSLIEAGDALSAGNLNDLETRIDNAFSAVDAEVATKADETEVTDLKNAIDSNTARIENLEQKAGGYSVVNYRGTNAVPTGKAKYGLVEKIVGKSRAWNQLVYRNLADIKSINTGGTWNDNVYSINGLTFTVNNDGSVTVTGTASANTAFAVTPQMVGGTNKKYLFAGCPSGGSTTSYMFGSNVDGAYDTGAGYIHQIGGSTQRFSVRIYGGYAISGSLTFKPITRDCSLIYPEGVPSTVAECVQKCPDILKYDAYGYSLVDTTVEGAESKGVNIWDEEYVFGQLRGMGSATSLQSKNYIEVEPNTAYYLYIGETSQVFVSEYDENYNGLSLTYANVANSSWTTKANAKFIKFVAVSVTSYNDNIQLALNSNSEKTSYHKHFTDTLSLPSPVTLRSAGTVSEVLTLETGKKTRPFGVIDLGRDVNSWGYDSTYAFFYVALSDKAFDANFTCSEYVNVGAKTDPQMADVLNMSCATNGGGWFYIKNTSKNGSDIVGGVCSWLNDVILNYHLATPLSDEQVCDPIINNTILTEGGGTINTKQTQTTVIDNCLDVGYLAI